MSRAEATQQRLKMRAITLLVPLALLVILAAAAAPTHAAHIHIDDGDANVDDIDGEMFTDMRRRRPRRLIYALGYLLHYA